MFILHTFYDLAAQQDICFFGESFIGLSEPKPVLPAKRGRKPKISPPIVDPSVASAEDLRSMLLSLFDNLPVAIESSVMRLSLPLSREIPVYSPEYYAHTYERIPTPDRLHPFQIPVVRLNLTNFLQISGRLISENNGVFIQGGTLKYWVHAAVFGAILVAKGKFIPGWAVDGKKKIRISWNTGADPVERGWIEDLIRIMPPFCVPATGWGAHDPDLIDQTAEMLIANFFPAIMQGCVFEGLSHEPERLEMTNTVINVQKFQMMYYIALTGKGKELGLNGLIPSDTTEARKLVGWMQQKTEVSSSTGFSLCLRITEPDDITSNWEIYYELRPDDDPTCLIKAYQIWNGYLPDLPGLPPLSVLEEVMLTELGKAARISSAILSSLKHPTPEKLTLKTSELWKFLSEETPMLLGEGIDVIIPSWWKERRVRPVIKVMAQKKTMKKPLFGIETLLSFDYQIALGDDFLTPEEFLSRVELKSSIIRTGDGWTVFDADDLIRTLERLKAKYEGDGVSAIEMLRLAADPGEQETLVELEGADDWCGNFLACIKEVPSLVPVNIPESFVGTLRPYQEVGLSFLMSGAKLGLGLCLADDMGLGKTPQTIAFLLAKKDEGKITRPSLLICPTSVAGNWEREINRFAPSLKIHIHHGSSRERSKGFMHCAKTHDLIITTYPLASKDTDLLTKPAWSSLILDEAQNIKNPHTKQTRAILEIKADHRIALTGTPVENRLSELWSIMHFLNRGYLGSLEQFRNNYAIPIEKDQDPQKTLELKQLIRPLLLRRLKSDKSIIQDLPEKMEYRVYVTLTREQVTLYQAVVDDLISTADTVSGIARRGLILAALTKLKQISDHPHLYTKDNKIKPSRSGKVQRLLEMLEEVREEGDAAIVFTQFATFATTLHQQIEEHFNEKALLLTGKTPRKTREELIDAFMQPDGPSIFVISLKAGGTGLNLTRANHVFHIDRWWNPAVEDQATDRAFRIGQTKDVLVHLMIAAGTLEERIDEVISGKRGLAVGILGTGDDWLTSLPTEELLDVVRLRDTVFEDY